MMADTEQDPVPTAEVETVADAPVAEPVVEPAAELTAAPEEPVAKAPAKIRKPRTPKAKAPVVTEAAVKVRKPRTVKAKPPVAAEAPAKAKFEPIKKKSAKLTVKRAAAPKAPAPQKETVKMATKTKTPEITAKIQETFKDASEKAKAAFEKSQAAFGDAGEFAKGNVEAMVASTKILASGMKTMGETYVAETKSAYETMTADIKELAAVKSPTEFFEVQSKLFRKNFDAAVASSSKKSEEMLKLANEAFQPLSTRVSLAVEKFKKAA